MWRRFQMKLLIPGVSTCRGISIKFTQISYIFAISSDLFQTNLNQAIKQLVVWHNKKSITSTQLVQLLMTYSHFAPANSTPNIFYALFYSQWLEITLITAFDSSIWFIPLLFALLRSALLLIMAHSVNAAAKAIHVIRRRHLLQRLNEFMYKFRISLTT